jgi:predicted O-linked N-acetylglucosamine transferase (SPINDLY family)
VTQEQQIKYLIDLYMRQQFTELVTQAERLTLDHPSSFQIWNLLAAGQRALGRLSAAKDSFRTAADLNPNFADAHYNLGIVLHDQGKFAEAISAYQRACDLSPNNATLHFNMGNTFLQQREFGKAISAYQQTLSIDQGYGEAYNNMASALIQQGNIAGAMSTYQRAIAFKPGYIDAYRNYAILLNGAGRIDEAVSVLQSALQNTPIDARIHKTLGHLLRGQRKFGGAVSAYRRAIELNPADFESHMAIGLTFSDQKETKEAIKAYRNAISIRPDFADAHNYLGAALADIGKIDEAIEAYRGALSINPNLAEAHNNLGNALYVQGKFKEAISAYKLSIELNPNGSDAYSNMGTALLNLGSTDEAFFAYKRAIEINPESAAGYKNYAGALSQAGKHDQAISAYQRALEINPNDVAVTAQLLHQQQFICDFRGSYSLEEASAHLGLQSEAIPPFIALSWSDRPDQQFSRAKAWVRAQFKGTSTVHPARPKGPTEKLRVGLFSADIRPHPMMYCLSGILSNYDPSAFELYAYSLHRGPAGDWPRIVTSQVDHYVDVQSLSDNALIDCVLSHDLDVLVDLTGYTAGNRCGVLQTRLAPVQINFLGFPGTMGADFIDYIVADALVIPEEQRQFYSEKVIYLPHSYFPIDYSHIEPARSTSRADHGLPEDALVFCCFNSSYKISAHEFSIWMRVLQKVEHSVLWLLKSNPWAEENLRKEARAADIDPARLIFAGKAPIAEHLERHRHADLFLDTFNVNAHTTACDALWAGVPVVTKIGRQFAARVAASVLNAVDLPDLVTSTDFGYEETILRLAQDSDALTALRARLRNAIGSSLLFDARRYTRNFEKGLRAAHDLGATGRAAEHIWVLDPKP